MDNWRGVFLQETLAVFRQHQEWADKALAQLESDEGLIALRTGKSSNARVEVKNLGSALIAVSQPGEALSWFSATT